MPLLHRPPPPAPNEVAYAPPASAVDAAPADAGAATCPNCGTPAPLAYCPACGQAQHDLHRSVRALATEFLDTFAAWDGKIPVTLWLLFRHPGRLTAEYLAGRRARFLPPLRLYLILVVVLVLAYRFFGRGTEPVRMNLEGGGRASPAPAVAAPASTPAVAGRVTGGGGLDSGLVASGPWQKLKRSYFGARINSLEHMSKEERNRALQSAFFAKLGNMFLALVPAFALLVRVLYRRAPFVYAEHLVFALHVHAFAAAAVALVVALPDRLRVLPLLWMPAYLFVALRRVYGGSRRRTLVKFALLGGGYLVALVAATVVTGLLAFLVG